MRISFVYSTGRLETQVMRTLDGDRRGLVISCPWQQPPLETFLAIRDQLTADERAEVAAAFGLADS